MAEIVEHWADKLANKVVDTFPNETSYTCAAGISPSGPVHIGNFRDIFTSDLVYRALKSQGKPATLLFSWDDYDRLRKVPAGLPESFRDFVGLPLCNVPDPSGEFESYALKNEAEFEGCLSQLGINPVIRRQSEEYKSGKYEESIRYALIRRKEIGEILRSFKTEGTEGANFDIENYYPIQVYSRFSGKDTTQVLSFDGNNEIIYRCLQTGKEDVLDLSCDRNVKLPWKVDWPMRWAAENACFEPGGHDHASPGGSYDVSRVISSDIFERPAPYFQGYAFVGIRGLNGKMSSSKGRVVTPSNLLEIYEPSMIRWFFARISPEQKFDFAFDSEVFRLYSEFDRDTKKAGVDELTSRVIELSKVDEFQRPLNNPIPFRQVLGYGQTVGFNKSKLEFILTSFGETFDPTSVNTRMQNAQNWLEQYNPDSAIVLNAEKSSDYLQSLDNEKRAQVEKLRQELISNPSLSLAELETLVYSIPKIPAETTIVNTKRQKEFFSAVYNLLFGTETGPRLSTFLWAGDKNKIIDLLEV